MGKKFSTEERKLLDALEGELQEVLSQAKGPVERNVKLSKAVRRDLVDTAKRRGMSLARLIAERKAMYVEAATRFAFMDLKAQPEGLSDGFMLIALNRERPN